MNQHYTAHLLQWKKNKNTNSWKVSLLLKPSVPMQPFVLHTVRALPTPPSLYPAYLFSHHAVPLSIITQSVPSVRLSPTAPSQFLSPPLPFLSTFISFICSLTYLLLCLRICRDMSALKMGCFDPWCGIQNRVRISLLPWNTFWSYVATSASLSSQSPECFIARTEGWLCLLRRTQQSNMMLCSTFELRSIAGCLQISAS